MPLSFSAVLRKLLFLFFAAALVAIGSVSQAQLLVNVGGALADPPAGNDADPTAGPLGDAPGTYLIYNTEHEQATSGDVQNYAGVTFSGVTGSFNVGVGFSYQNEMNPFVARQAFDRGEVIIAGTQSSFYEHVVGLDNRNGNAESYSLDLTGLPPNTAFTLTTYHFDANNQAATFTTDLTGDEIFQQHSATSATFNDPLAAVFDFALTSDATGAASITFQPAAGVFFFINGFDLAAASSGVLLGDVDLSGEVNFLDISPFINVLSANGFQLEADIDLDGAVTFLDIQPFINILAGL